MQNLIDGYCVKCKSKTKGVNPKPKVSKNGRYMVQSECSQCGSTKSRFVSKTMMSGKGFKDFFNKVGDVFKNIGNTVKDGFEKGFNFMKDGVQNKHWLSQVVLPNLLPGPVGKIAGEVIKEKTGYGIKVKRGKKKGGSVRRPDGSYSMYAGQYQGPGGPGSRFGDNILKKGGSARFIEREPMESYFKGKYKL